MGMDIHPPSEVLHASKREHSFFHGSAAACPRKEGYNGLFITMYPKVFNNVFLLVGLTTLGAFNKCDWLIYQVECPNGPTKNCKPQKGKFCVSSLEMYDFLSL